MTARELKERLGAVEAEGRPDDAPALTFVAKSAKGIGVRPTLLSERPSGERVYSVTVKQLRRMVEKAEAAVVAQELETRDNGDLVIFWPNGDPGIKFQADGFVCFAYPGDSHPLDGVAITLAPDVVEQLRGWCEARMIEHAERSQS